MSIDRHLILGHLDRLARPFCLRHSRNIVNSIETSRVRSQGPSNAIGMMSGSRFGRRCCLRRIGNLTRQHSRRKAIGQLEANVSGWSVRTETRHAGRRLGRRLLVLVGHIVVGKGDSVVPTVAVRVPILWVLAGDRHDVGNKKNVNG